MICKYYKVIDGSTFVGVGTSIQFLQFQSKHRIMLACSEEEAQYIMIGDNIYHASWMVPESVTQRGKYKTVSVIEIDEEEYNLLHEVENYEIPEPEITPEEIEETDIITQSTLDFVISQKIKSMKLACNNAITSGFDVVLSNDEKKHFSLTIQDQLNLISLSAMVAAGSDRIPYHADGELCAYYSAEDIQAIIEKARATVTEYTTYFNSLQRYISSLDNVNDVSAIYWGVDLPEEFQSEVMKGKAI